MTTPPNDTLPTPLLTIDELERLDISESHIENEFVHAVALRLGWTGIYELSDFALAREVFPVGARFMGHPPNSKPYTNVVVPDYVNSLDAPLTLLSSHTDIHIYLRNDFDYTAQVINPKVYIGTQSTRAAALTIAALRALESAKR